MLIICYDDFISSMNPFVQWKNKKGIPAEIVPVSTIGNTVNDLQDYINNYYYNNGLTYLLLVGDAAQIPTHIVNGSASDPSYGFIEGDDAFSEILVGRFSEIIYLILILRLEELSNMKNLKILIQVT